MTQKTSTTWASITKSVRAWALKHGGSAERKRNEYIWSLKWGSNIVNIQRDSGTDFTTFSFAVGLTGDDLAYYLKIGGHDWRVIMRTMNAQLGRTEISFIAGPAPGYLLLDMLYDDAFTKDELFRRARNVVLTGLYLLASMKIGKAIAGMRGAEPMEPSDIDVSFDTDEDLKADRVTSELAGGELGPYRFETTEGLVSSLILSVMARLEQDYGPVLDTKFVIDWIVENHQLPVTLLRETMNHLKKIGAVVEVGKRQIRRAV